MRWISANAPPSTRHEKRRRNECDGALRFNLAAMGRQPNWDYFFFAFLAVFAFGAAFAAFFFAAMWRSNEWVRAHPTHPRMPCESQTKS